MNSVLVCCLIVILSFSIYRRYSETIVYAKPTQIDANQEKIQDEQGQANDLSGNVSDNDSSDSTPSDNDEPEEKDHFTLYSIGDVFTAQSGSGMLNCNVRNQSDSTHDIIMSVYISEEELKEHDLSTEGLEDGKCLIAQSGLFEPGYRITTVQLLSLPDGSFLPAGTYDLTMNERYYHHESGELSSYETNIAVTLEVAE